MGGDQRVDLRPTIIAFVAVHSPAQEHDAESSPNLQRFITNHVRHECQEFRDLLMSTALMFKYAIGCGNLTAASLAYTLHCTANVRPI